MTTHLTEVLNKANGAGYAIDPRHSNVRIFVNAVFLTDLQLDRYRGGAGELIALECERAEAECYRHALTYVDAPEEWLRTFSKAVWRDKSQNIVSGMLLVFSLYVDVGGIDMMPIC